MWKDSERWWNGGTMMPKGISSPLVNADCPVTECIFTSDGSLINQSDVVVFYAQTMKDFPLIRNYQQRFVFAQLESPITHDLSSILNDNRVRFGYFNWTMTYRWDSDIVHRGEYGYMVTKSNHTGMGIRARILNSWSNQMDYLLPQTDHKVAKNFHFIDKIIKKKTKLVAWFVSHCTTPIRREEYVRQLSRYVTIDIFGACNNRKCPTNCDEMLRTHYKFYLAFENSWCHDYVTEKFYRPLIHNTVPIVLGGANYSRFAPPHSYINARDFNSPRELAQYLLLLNKTDTLYAAYFEWKEQFDVLLVDNYGLCELCQMAHNAILPSKSYRDIKKWWVDGGRCEKNTKLYF